MSDPNAVGLDDVTAAGFVGSVVYSFIEIVHAKRPLTSSVKAFLAPTLSFVFMGLLYAVIAISQGTIFPLPKIITLAWQAYGHSQGQHNITAATTADAAYAQGQAGATEPDTDISPESAPAAPPSPPINLLNQTNPNAIQTPPVVPPITPQGGTN